MRWLAVFLVLVACASHPVVLDEASVHGAGDALEEKLRGLEVAERATLRVSETADARLAPEGERRVVECGKFRVSSVDSHPDYVLLAGVSGNTATWEIVELATHRRVLLATKRLDR